MITAELRETLIVAVLQQLDAVHPSGLSARTLLIPIKQSGLGDLVEKDLVSLLADLKHKGWVDASPSASAPELVRYHRTEEGRVFLRQSGF